MSVTYTVMVSYDNTTWLDISAYVIRNSVTMTYSLHASDSLDPNTSSAKFTLLGYKTLLDTLLTSTDPVYCMILRDTASFINGIISPVTKVVPSAARITATEITVEDFTLSKLKKPITSIINWSNYYVCNPNATASSIVHKLCSILNVNVAAYPTITTVIPYVCVLESDKKTYYELLSAVLYEVGYLFYFDRSGLLTFYNLAECPTSYSTIIQEFLNEIGNSASDIIALQNSTKRGSYDEVKLTWYGKEKKTDLLVFEDTTGATDEYDCVIEVESDDYYPDKDSDSGTVYSQYANDSWTILNVVDASLSESDTGLTLVTAFQNFGKKCLFSYENTSNTTKVIHSLKAVGTAWVQTDLNTTTLEINSDVRNILEYTCEYIYTKTVTDALATILKNFYKYNTLTFTVQSSTFYDLGTYVKIVDTARLGKTGYGRIRQIEYKADGTYVYQIESICEYDNTALSTSVSTKTSSDTANLANAVTVASASATAASIKISLSASSALRSRVGKLTPASITATAAYSNGSTYPGRFIIAISPDGTTFVDDYTSAGNESSVSYTIPVSVTIDGTEYYVASVRIRLYAAGGTATKYDERFISIGADSSVVPLYWGSLTVAPTSGIIENDYYFDANDASSGGGVIRYYTGTEWLEATSSWVYYGTAYAACRLDLVAWATEKGETVVAVKAIIASLVANSGFIAELSSLVINSAALCNDNVTPRTVLDLANAILQTYAADQTKSAKIAESVISSLTGGYRLDHSGQSLDWRLDESNELLGQLQYGASTGYLEAKNLASEVRGACSPTALSCTNKSVLSTAYTFINHSLVVSKSSVSGLGLLSAIDSQGYQVVYSIISTDGVLGSFVTVPGLYTICSTELLDGTILLIVGDNSNIYTYSLSLAGVMTLLSTELLSAFPFSGSPSGMRAQGVCASDGSVYSVIKISGSLELVKRTAAGVWSDLGAVLSSTYNYGQWALSINSETDLITMTYSTLESSQLTYCKTYTPSAGSWSSATQINAFGWYSHSLYEFWSGVKIAAFTMDNQLVFQYYTGSAWSALTAGVSVVAYGSAMLRLTDSSFTIYYIDTNKNLSYASLAVTLSGPASKYMALVGTGIIEEGYVSGSGWYRKFGNGDLECWGSVGPLTIIMGNGYVYISSNTTLITPVFPYAFYSTPNFQHSVSSAASNYSWSSVGGYATTQFGCPLVIFSVGIGPQASVDWRAIGRWKL